jgi:hypothetical protein
VNAVQLQEIKDRWPKYTPAMGWDSHGVARNDINVLLAEVERATDSIKVQEVYLALLVAGMREVVRLSEATDKHAAAIAYYAKLFELAQESGDLDKCDEGAIAAVAERAGVPIEYTGAIVALDTNTVQVMPVQGRWSGKTHTRPDFPVDPADYE